MITSPGSSAPGTAEPVNPGETSRLDNYCAGTTSVGLLIVLKCAAEYGSFEQWGQEWLLVTSRGVVQPLQQPRGGKLHDVTRRVELLRRERHTHLDQLA